MSEQKTEQAAKVEPQEPEKKSFFKRIVNKIDGAMKEKADQKAAEGECCGSDGKGSKCC